MSEKHTVEELIEDHALERVPEGDRHTWLDLSWGTVGIVTTLIQLFIGALVTFIAGIKLGLIAGVLVAVIGGTLGWGLGHIAYRSGLASTVMARFYGFGIKGSVIASLIYGFMIIGFIAVENILLYKGFLFYFGAEDTLANQIICYGTLTVAWILLTAYGFDLVARFSSIMTIGFVAVLIYMMIDIVARSGQSWADVMAFGVQLPPEVLTRMGLEEETARLIFCINILIGPAGALALIDADLGRYARSSADIGVAAYLGNLFLDIIMVAIGGIVMYAGMPYLVDHYVSVEGMAREAAQQVAIENPDRVAAAFIIFGGVIGAVLMVLAQSKAQVLNTYSSALSLTNMFDAIFSWRPGRIVFVVLANLLSLVFLYEEILTFFNDFLKTLGILTTCFGGIMLADYFFVRPRLGHRDTSIYGADLVNWAGVLSIAAGFVMAHYILHDIIQIEFFTALAFSFFVYPVLRLYVLRPRYRAAAL